jgi:hypothetical protein
VGAGGLPARDARAGADVAAWAAEVGASAAEAYRAGAPSRPGARKSDLIDALAIARAALREPLLDSPRPEEARLRELKLLVDHRDDLVDERRRAQQRLRWHLHELDPTQQVPLGALDRAVWLDRVPVSRRRSRVGESAVAPPGFAPDSQGILVIS